MDGPITVGVVVAGRRAPAWVADTIDALRGDGHRVLVCAADPPPRGPGRFGALLLGMYLRVDRRVFGRPDDPGRIVALPADDGAAPGEGAATGVPAIVVRLDGGGGADGLPDAWNATPPTTLVLEHGADLPPRARAAARSWTPALAELILRRTSTISRLVAIPGPEVDDSGTVGTRQAIGQVVSQVDRLSLSRGTRSHLGKLPRLVVRGVEACIAGVPTGDVPAPASASATVASGHASPDRDPLATRTIVTGLTDVVLGYARRAWKRTIAPERWVVAIARGPGPIGVAGRSFRFPAIPDGREWADPFPVRYEGRDLLFIEEYVRAVGRGRLAVVELDDSQRGWRSVETILDLPTHLSYPFVFEWEGAWYLLPEQAAAGRLELYVATHFPTGWTLHSTALAEPAADATIARIGDRWWLFAALSAASGLPADDLHLFHSASPLGPWTPHARNPVVSDVRTARPGGRCFERDGTWYRVAQDGAERYGHSLAIVRIDRLDPDGYAETVVDVIRPDWAPDLIATHTLNQEGDLVAIDATLAERRRWLRWLPG